MAEIPEEEAKTRPGAAESDQRGYHANTHIISIAVHSRDILGSTKVGRPPDGVSVMPKSAHRGTILGFSAAPR